MYATVDQLKDAIPAQDLILLTDHDGAADAVDDARLTSALQDATATIDGWIAKRVTLPLAEPPRMLMVVCRDLALHRLYANTGRVTEAAEKLHDAAMAYLAKVSKGEISIGDETGGDEIVTSPGAVVEEGPERVFTRDRLRSF